MVNQEKRKLVYSGALIVVLSVIMGALFNSAWSDIYFQVKIFEGQIEASLPFISSGALQVFAMFALGLYTAWAVLFALDFRKRYQGILILVGSAVALLTLAQQGIFLPNINLNMQNVIGLLLGLSAGLASEIIQTPLRDEPGDLFYFSFEESSMERIVADDGDKYLAGFPVATWGLFGIIVLLVAVANIILLLGGASVFVKVASLPLSTAFGYLLFTLVDFSPNTVTTEDVQIEILGPTGAGKTLSIYGLLEAAKAKSDKYSQPEPNENMQWLISTINGNEEAVSDPDNPFQRYPDKDWPVPSTRRVLLDIWFSFLYGDVFKKRIQIGHLDHGGEFFWELFGDTNGQQVATDGGVDDDKGDDWGSVSDSDSESSDKDAKEEVDKIDAKADEIDAKSGVPTEDSTSESHRTDSGGTEESNSAPEEANKREQLKSLEERVKSANTLVFLLDMTRLYKGANSDAETGVGIKKMIDIYNHSNPENVVLIATKTDVITDVFKDRYDYENVEPHKNAVEYDEFIEFITTSLQSNSGVEELMQSTGVDTIHPVYYKTEEVNGALVPRNEDDDQLFDQANNPLDPVGYEQALDKIVSKL